jgi:hypothetical protein
VNQSEKYICHLQSALSKARYNLVVAELDRLHQKMDYELKIDDKAEKKIRELESIIHRLELERESSRYNADNLQVVVSFTLYLFFFGVIINLFFPILVERS